MTHLALDLREFLTQVRFAHPAWLWLLAVPLLYRVLRRVAERRDRSRWHAIGRPGAVAALHNGLFTRPVTVRLGLWLAWSALAIAVAGPRWGRAEERGIAFGRDLVLVLDFSRSMWAEDMADRRNPARWQAAVAGARALVDALRSRGGHRVAVILFAARPQILVPLTTDYDHVVFRLGELDATTPPADIRPADDSAASGTRIGAAIAAALASHDARFPGFQDIILLTDGDDPATDGEWRSGALAARRAGVPVHVVGLGDPTADSFVFLRGGPLEFVDKNGIRVPVQTRLNEDVAETIARDSNGTYLASRRETPDLSALYDAAIDASAKRELDDERLPQLRDRRVPFTFAALVLIALAWWRER